MQQNNLNVPEYVTPLLSYVEKLCNSHSGRTFLLISVFLFKLAIVIGTWNKKG